MKKLLITLFLLSTLYVACQSNGITRNSKIIINEFHQENGENNMHKLFLASFFSDTAELFVEFTENTCSGKRVVFIPTACIPVKIAYLTANADKRALKKLGMIIDELDVSKASKDEIENKIRSTDYIFVAGGNTFFLLQEMKHSGADKLIIEHIENGKIYISTSAGSIITSKNIEYIKYMDNPKAAPNLNNNFSALGIVDFYIVPHNTHIFMKGMVKNIISKYSEELNLFSISDKQAIIIKNNKVEIIEVRK